MWVMASGTWVGVLLVALAVIAACGEDGEGDVPSAMTGSARGMADDASRPGAGGPVVRVDDGGAQDAAADASALDGGLDASLDGSVSDAMPSPMPIEDAALDARVGTGGVSGSGGSGGAGGAAAFGGF